MEFIDFIKNGVLEINLEVSTKEDVFRILCERLYKNKKVRSGFYQALIRREKKFPTGLLLRKHNIAIPHADPDNIIQSSIAIATLKNPVVFQCMDNENKSIEVRIIFLLALEKAHSNVEVLKKIMLMIQDELFLQDLLQAKNRDNIIRIISQKYEI